MKFFSNYQADRIERSTLIWVLVAQGVSIFPLFFKLPIWVAVVWWVALIWRVQIFRGVARFPNTLIKICLGVSCVALFIGSYAGVAGVEPMVGFLVCSFVLKLIEMYNQKDALIVLFIGFIAVAAQFLFAQTIDAAIFGAFSFWVLLTAWRAVVINRPTPWRKQLRISLAMLLQSVPMLLVMFIVMPRLGPLWSVPLPQAQGKTGFSDSLELGDIGQLVRTYETAFNVEFDGVPPRPENLYWRGLVLDQYDGKQWRAGGQWIFNKTESAQLSQYEVTKYSVILEPHYQQWLFSIGFPIEAESNQLKLRRTRHGLLNSFQPVAQKVQYKVESILDLPSLESELPARDWQAQTQYPQNFNPRTQALAQQWLDQGLDQTDIIQAALEKYRASFFYTLSPPPLGLHSVDDFLFNSQRGFCEHFASSFVLLMRAANIPARVVVGYQGGTFNPKGFLTVRQADAHAWAEVWLDGVGWKTVDPTAAVAPNRIQLGIDQALGESDRQVLASAHWQKRWFNQLQQQWEAMGYSWQRWVLNYDNDKKDAFLSKWFGEISPWRIGLIFVTVCGLVLLIVCFVFWLGHKKIERKKEDKIIECWLKRINKYGYFREPSETLEQFTQRVVTARPELKTQLNAVTKTYYAIKYQEAGEGVWRKFERAVALPL